MTFPIHRVFQHCRFASIKSARGVRDEIYRLSRKLIKLDEPLEVCGDLRLTKYARGLCSQSQQWGDCNTVVVASLPGHKTRHHQTANSPCKMHLHKKSAGNIYSPVVF
jgi:hypothetical protein